VINKFNATCACCGGTVLAGQGDTNLDESGHWVTKHIGACPTRPPSPTGRGLYQPATGYHDPWLAGLAGSDYDDEFYREHGMTQADYRDAMCPDEGDKG